MNDSDIYQRTNASRYESTSGGQYLGSANRCTCLGFCIPLFIVVSVLMLPLILQGTMIFVVGDPILYLISLVSIFGPIVMCLLIMWYAWNHVRNRSEKPISE
jgi:Flp pilus assembly protein TadB